MNLHANAALSLNRRRQLCRRIVQERWMVRQGSCAASRIVPYSSSPLLAGRDERRRLLRRDVHGEDE
jgi:hypothetical protein